MIDNYFDYFKKIIKKNRLVHLYLLSGERGSGKMALAINVAYEILNKHAVNGNLRTQLQKREYPNFFVIEPEKESIKKEQIMDLQREFSKTSIILGPRVYLISHVDRMTVEAANGLLKFLEEPQSKETYGFLLTEKKDSVISTIRSRSQIVNIDCPSYFYVSEELMKKGASPKQTSIIPLITKNLDEAIYLSENEEINVLIELIIGFIEAWNQNKSLLIYLSNKSLLYDKTYYEYFINILIVLFLDIIHIKINHFITLVFLKEELNIMSTSLNIEKTNEIIDFLQKNLNEKKYYINIDLAITNMAIGIKKRR